MELFGAPAEDDLGVGFAHEEGVGVGCYGEEEDYPLRPAPTFPLGDEATYDGACPYHRQWQLKQGERSVLPKVGPEKGANMKMLIATALVAGGNRSAIVPAPTANAGAPNTPAKNRQIMKDAMFWEQPAPSVNSAKAGKVIR